MGNTMIPSVRNKQTIQILKKLREQGAPEREGEIGTVSLDMTMPKPKKLEAELEGEAETDEAEGLEEEEAGQSAPLMPPSNLMRRKKKL